MVSGVTIGSPRVRSRWVRLDIITARTTASPGCPTNARSGATEADVATPSYYICSSMAKNSGRENHFGMQMELFILHFVISLLLDYSGESVCLEICNIIVPVISD